MQDLKELNEVIAGIKDEICKGAETLTTSRGVYEFKKTFLDNKQGRIGLLMKEMRNVPNNQKAEFGKTINGAKEWANQFFDELDHIVAHEIIGNPFRVLALTVAAAVHRIYRMILCKARYQHIKDLMGLAVSVDKDDGRPLPPYFVIKLRSVYSYLHVSQVGRLDEDSRPFLRCGMLSLRACARGRLIIFYSSGMDGSRGSFWRAGLHSFWRARNYMRRFIQTNCALNS